MSSNRNDLPRQYGVRNQERDYLVLDPVSKQAVRPDAPGLGAGWHEPALFDAESATALAAKLNAATAADDHWRIEQAPLPCPCCGRELLVDDLDFLYPQNREYTKWRAGCNEHDFGCGYEVLGSTADEVLEKWQAGAPHEGDAEDFGMAERYCLVRIDGDPLAAVLPLRFEVAGVSVSVTRADPASGATYELRGTFASQPALVRRALRGLRSSCEDVLKDAPREVVDYGRRVTESAKG